jgi:hypothetical protein
MRCTRSRELQESELGPQLVMMEEGEEVLVEAGAFLEAVVVAWVAVQRLRGTDPDGFGNQPRQIVNEIPRKQDWRKNRLMS